jgi:hypothetical protein
MKRSLTAIPLIALTAALLTPSAATGATPEPVDVTLTFAAREACSFPISIAVTGKEGFNEVPNNPTFTGGIATAPGERITVTNLSDPSKMVTVTASGTFHWIELPGGQLQIVASGHNFLFAEPEAGVSALATTGPIEVLIADGHIARVDLSRARVRDLCAELA